MQTHHSLTNHNCKSLGATTLPSVTLIGQSMLYSKNEILDSSQKIMNCNDAQLKAEY